MLSCRHVLSHNQRRGQRCVIHLLVFSPILTVLLWPHCNTSATFPEPLPLLFSHLWCGSSHFLVVTPSAFTLTRDTHDKLGVEVKVMGCESNAPAPAIHMNTYTRRLLEVQIQKISVVCVFTILHTIPLDTQPRSEAKHKGYVANGVMTWMYNTQRKQEMEILTSFTSSFHSNMCFSPTSSMQLQYRTLGYLQICSSFSILGKRKRKRKFSSVFMVY